MKQEFLALVEEIIPTYIEDVYDQSENTNPFIGIRNLSDKQCELIRCYNDLYNGDFAFESGVELMTPAELIDLLIRWNKAIENTSKGKKAQVAFQKNAIQSLLNRLDCLCNGVERLTVLSSEIRFYSDALDSERDLSRINLAVFNSTPWRMENYKRAFLAGKYDLANKLATESFSDRFVAKLPYDKSDLVSDVVLRLFENSFFNTVFKELSEIENEVHDEKLKNSFYNFINAFSDINESSLDSILVKLGSIVRSNPEKRESFISFFNKMAAKPLDKDFVKTLYDMMFKDGITDKALTTIFDAYKYVPVEDAKTLLTVQSYYIGDETVDSNTFCNVARLFSEKKDASLANFFSTVYFLCREDAVPLRLLTDILRRTNSEELKDYSAASKSSLIEVIRIVVKNMVSVKNREEIRKYKDIISKCATIPNLKGGKKPDTDLCSYKLFQTMCLLKETSLGLDDVDTLVTSICNSKTMREVESIAELGTHDAMFDKDRIPSICQKIESDGYLSLEAVFSGMLLKYREHVKPVKLCDATIFGYEDVSEFLLNLYNLDISEDLAYYFDAGNRDLANVGKVCTGYRIDCNNPVKDDQKTFYK